jgi:CheY-like chemotaxis protein
MTSLPFSAPVVLVTEDEVLVRMLIADVLQEAGYTVLEATTAVEALALLEARPDIGVLFADIDLPGGVDGVELARRVGDRHPGVALVLSSGRNRPGGDGVPAGACFVPKPWTNAALMACIARAVRRARPAVGGPGAVWTDLSLAALAR